MADPIEVHKFGCSNWSLQQHFALYSVIYAVHYIFQQDMRMCINGIRPIFKEFWQ